MVKTYTQLLRERKKKNKEFTLRIIKIHIKENKLNSLKNCEEKDLLKFYEWVKDRYQYDY